MPRIFDNIETKLLSALQETLSLSERADFCVGYFNLRGWKYLDAYIENWSGDEGNCCRLLVGMQKLPKDELLHALRISKDDIEIDNQTALGLKKSLAEEFRQQLTMGTPIDFNIRAGNSLVGYVSVDQIRKAAETDAADRERIDHKGGQAQMDPI